MLLDVDVESLILKLIESEVVCGQFYFLKCFVFIIS